MPIKLNISQLRQFIERWNGCHAGEQMSLLANLTPDERDSMLSLAKVVQRELGVAA